MCAQYHVIAKTNPRDPNAPVKYYPSVVSTGRANIRHLAQQIADISTLSPIDVVATLEALLLVIPQELSAGRIVDLGDLGSFRLRVQTEGSEVEAAVSRHNIKRVTARFVPGKEFNRTLAQTEFEKVRE